MRCSQSFTANFFFRRSSFMKNLRVKATRMATMRTSAKIGGMRLFRSEPMVEPYKTLGIMIVTRLQSTIGICLEGWRERTSLAKLKSAVPKTKGQQRVVASASEQLRMSMSSSTLNSPKEFPEVLQMAAAMGKKRQTAMGYPPRGKMGRCWQLFSMHWYWQGQVAFYPQGMVTIDNPTLYFRQRWYNWTQMHSIGYFWSECDESSDLTIYINKCINCYACLNTINKISDGYFTL